MGGVPLAQRIWDAARTRSGLAVQLATIGLVVWAAFLPFRIFSFDRVFLGSGPGDRQLAVVADVVRHYTSPNQEVVTGDPMLCVLAARPCVSEMVDTSYVRVQTGKLTNALGYTESANVPVAVMGRALCLDPYMAGYDRWIMAHFRLVMQARIESDIDCPWRSDGTAVRPRGHSGVYVRGISREQ